MTGKFLLIGWDAADWKLIHPLLDSGQLPHLAALVEGGVSGPLAGLNPPVSPLLWATLATGHTADRHGVLSDFQPDPFGGAPQPVSRQDWKRQPVWEILAAQGLTTEIINWPASHPAHLHDPELHLRPEEVYPEDLALLVPQLDRVTPGDQPKMDQLAQLMSQTVTVHAIATDRLMRGEWNFGAVAYGMIGQASSAFRAETPESPFGAVIAGAYRFLDLMLGSLLQIAGEEARVMLVSTHGSDAAYRPNGILCLAGPELRQDELLHGAGLLDIAPTILALHGMAASSEMPGRVLTEAFLTPPALPERVPSWEMPIETTTGGGNLEALDQLAALGYQDSEPDDPATAAVRRQQNYHLAQIHLESNRAADALELLDQAKGPDAGTPQLMALELMRAYALLKLSRLNEAREVVDQLCARYPQAPEPLWALANLALAQGARNQALTHLQKAEAIAP
ncbi:MAG: alkaline phosphatase family protein, partial [Acidobacteria bacterium]|nr:alkaline phosphatase family protein [Acidobacteriota bacterium]